MTETTVSASHFRVHFKEIANAVARGEQACTVVRHGLELAGLVSLEDIDFLREHKWGKEAPKKEPEPEIIKLVHPGRMSLKILQDAYESTTGTKDWEIMGWR